MFEHTELEIREIVRDEVEKILGGVQANCPHLSSGSFLADGSIVCDGCGKQLTESED